MTETNKIIGTSKKEVVECNFCGRTFHHGSGISEGDDCPSDDCPSKDEAV